jgi:hypothetical protein
MTIRDLAKFVESLPDWAMLRGCFGGFIDPTDIDGCVERGGICLFLEHKLPGVPLKRAQEIAFNALAAQGNSVIVFWGQSPDGSDINRIRLFHDGLNREKWDASLEDVRNTACWWFKRADDLYRARRSVPPIKGAD